MKFRWSYVFLIISLLSLPFTGLDFTHHAHNSWLYHQMILEWDFLSENPYFGSQITYAYGIPAYAVAGLVWFLFSIHSINILQAVTILINYLILRKLFPKSERWVSVLTFLNLFFTIWDAYVAAFSNCLFWLATYAYFKNKKWWPIPLLIAAFNHPYVLISCLFYAVQAPILIFPLSIILSFFLIAGSVFTEGIYFPVYTVFMGLARIVINLLPVMALITRGDIKLKSFKIIKKISTYKVTIPVLLVVIIIMGGLLANLAIYTLVMQPENSVNFEMFEGLPLVNGTVRVVDYLYLPSVYVLPHQGFVLEAGSFRENNPQHMIKYYWNNITEYESFVEEGDFSYVLMCKMCNPQSNEKEMLEDNYNLIWENDFYSMYSLT